MGYRLLLHRHGFGVYGAAEKPLQVVELDRRDQLPVLIGLFHLHPDAPKGLSFDDIWRFQVFRHMRSINSLRKTVDRYVDRLDRLTLLGKQRLLGIVYGTGVTKGKLFLTIASGTKLDISEELHRFVRENAHPDAARWHSLPPHDLTQLHRFASAIQLAAVQFDSGKIRDAKATLLASLKGLIEPRYKGVILMRAARACFRLGEELKADEHLKSAMQLIESMQRPRDLILLARARYNRAWFAYQKGVFGYDLILRAEKELSSAGPDDIRHGYIATQRGLLVVKDIERNHAGLPPDDLKSRGHEAMRYLAHAIYLLVRSEDFWGAQEACWNLAYALYSIGNIKAVEIPYTTGLLGHDNVEILRWIELSRNIANQHYTGSDSVRNHVLAASVYMNRARDFANADKHFKTAEAAADDKERTTSPRELGRLYERRTHYYLEMCALDGAKITGYEQLAAASYKSAEKSWSVKGLESLLSNELHAHYRLKGGCVVRK